MQCLARLATSSDPGAGPDPQTGRLSRLAVSRARPKHGLDLGLYWLVLRHRLTCVLTCARAKIAPPPYRGYHSNLLQLSVGLHALYLTLFVTHTCYRSSGLVGSCSQASRHGSGSLLLAPRWEWAAGRRHLTLSDYATGPRQEGFCAPACRPSLSPGVHPQVSVGVDNRRQNPGQSVGALAQFLFKTSVMGIRQALHDTTEHSRACCCAAAPANGQNGCACAGGAAVKLRGVGSHTMACYAPTPAADWPHSCTWACRVGQRLVRLAR